MERNLAYGTHSEVGPFGHLSTPLSISQDAELAVIAVEANNNPLDHVYESIDENEPSYAAVDAEHNISDKPQQSTAEDVIP